MNFLRIDDTTGKYQRNEPLVLNLDQVVSARWERHQATEGPDYRRLHIRTTNPEWGLTLDDTDQAHQVWSHLHRIAVNPLSGRPGVRAIDPSEANPPFVDNPQKETP
jgi:hypothetical protein